MESSSDRPSPWWYRQRGTVIGAIYFAGFFFGYLRFSGPAAHPVADLGNGATILWAAFACALVAWFWRAAGTAFLHRDVVFASDVQADRLVVAGPFRYVRNPLYLGNVFLALAMGVLAPPVGFAIIVLGNAAFVGLLAAEEARGLATRYGAVYTAFRAAVPAFIPRLTPAHVPGSVSAPAAWPQALAGESFCLLMGIAILPLALFGDAGQPAFYTLVILAMIIFSTLGWLAGRTRSRKRAANP